MKVASFLTKKLKEYH